MKKLVLLIVVFLFGKSIYAQFGSAGTITFKRVENQHMAYKIEMSETNRNYGDMLKYIPKNKTSFFKMTFNKNGSYYKFEKDGDEKMPEFWGKQPVSENKVWIDFQQKNYNAIKEIYGSTFQLKDSLPQYKWKIHDEMRQIAGYTCRKATTIISDTVVVVAYYSPQILVSGGPESFNGLPGMILGLAVPRLYTSWFATEVNFDQVTIPPIEYAKRVKEINNEAFQKTIREQLKEWGGFGQSTILKTTL